MTSSGNYGGVADSVTSSSDYRFLDLTSAGTNKLLAVDLTTYNLITYDGTTVGGYPHMLASRNNIDFDGMNKNKQGIHYSVLTSNDTATSADWAVIEMDSAIINDSEMGTFSGGAFVCSKRGGLYEVTIEARMSGAGFISAGTSGAAHTQQQYTPDDGSITATILVNASLNDSIQVLAKGSGADRTVYANYTRMKVVYLGS